MCNYDHKAKKYKYKAKTTTENDDAHNIGSNSKCRIQSCKISALPPTICSVAVIPLETLHERLKTWAVQTTPVQTLSEPLHWIQQQEYQWKQHSHHNNKYISKDTIGPVVQYPCTLLWHHRTESDQVMNLLHCKH